MGPPPQMITVVVSSRGLPLSLVLFGGMIVQLKVNLE